MGSPQTARNGVGLVTIMPQCKEIAVFGGLSANVDTAVATEALFVKVDGVNCDNWFSDWLEIEVYRRHGMADASDY